MDVNPIVLFEHSLKLKMENAKKSSKSPAKKRVKMLDDEPASPAEDDQRQVNIILPSK